MTPDVAASLLFTLIGLLTTFCIWHFGVRPYLLDRFRSELFDLRDDLFDYAAEDHISFEDPYYGSLRKWINVQIRMAHRITFFDTILITRFHDDNNSTSESVERKLDRLHNIMSGKRGKTMQIFAFRSLFISGKYLLLRSPSLWVYFIFKLTQSLFYDLHDKGLDYKDTLQEWGRKTERQIRVTGGVPS